MKHRSKALIALLLLCTVLLTSCGSRLAGKKAGTAYLDSSEALKSAEEYEIITSRTVTSTDGKEVVSSEKATYRRDGNRFYMQNADHKNPLLNMEGWYVDGYSYAAYNSMKVKTAISEAEYLKSAGSDSLTSYLPEFSKEMLKGLRFEGERDARYIVIRLSAAQYEESFGSYGIGGEITGEVTFTVYFDDSATVTKTVTSFCMILADAKVYSESVTEIRLSSQEIHEPENASEFELVG